MPALGTTDSNGYTLIFYTSKYSLVLSPSDEYVVEDKDRNPLKVTQDLKEAVQFYFKSNEIPVKGITTKVEQASKVLRNSTRGLPKATRSKLSIDFDKVYNPKKTIEEELGLGLGYKVISLLSSSSRPGIVYYQVETPGGSKYCTCPGYRFRRTCSHLDTIESLS